MNLGCRDEHSIILSKRSLTQKPTHRMAPFTQTSRKDKIAMESRSGVARGRREGMIHYTSGGGNSRGRLLFSISQRVSDDPGKAGFVRAVPTIRPRSWECAASQGERGFAEVLEVRILK